MNNKLIDKRDILSGLLGLVVIGLYWIATYIIITILA